MMQQAKTAWERALESAIQSARKLCDVTVCRDVALALIAYKLLSDVHAAHLKRDWTFPLMLNRASDGFLTTDDLSQTLQEVSHAIPQVEDIFADMTERLSALAVSEDKREDVLKILFEAIAPFDFAKIDPAERGAAYARQIEKLAKCRKAPLSVTPAAVSELIAAIVTHGKRDTEAVSIYDPTLGSASLLLKTGACFPDTTAVNYYGQENDQHTLCIARWNCLLHGIAPEAAHLTEGDTLAEDWFSHATLDLAYDIMVMQPPYGARWAAEQYLLYDPRFAAVGVLPPRTHADNAFLLHGLYQLKEDGIMAIILPHGVLFRGGPDGKIRQYLIENGLIAAVIGLPANLFYDSKIPCALLILQKHRPSKDILVIDASKEYAQDGRQNILTPQNTQRIVQAYLRREDEPHFCHLATIEEIRTNDYNLNIPRYVDTFEPEPECDFPALTKEMATRRQQIVANKNELLRAMQQLTPSDEDTMRMIQVFQKIIK